MITNFYTGKSAAGANTLKQVKGWPAFMTAVRKEDDGAQGSVNNKTNGTPGRYLSKKIKHSNA